MSAKDNFAQAMKELLNGEVDAAEKEEKKPATSSSFSSFSQPEPKRQVEFRPEEVEEESSYETREVYESVAVSEVVAPEPPLPEPPAPEPAVEVKPFIPVYTPPMAPAPAAPPAPAPAPSVPQPEYRAAPASFSSTSTNFTAVATNPAPAPQVSMPSMSSMSSLPSLSTVGSGETTVIAPGTTLVGDITTSGGLRVGGNVKGNVKVASMMELNGKVIGDIEAADAVIVGSIIRGNVTVANVLTMDADTTVVGDVSAKNVDVNGKIKGNLTVEERGHFQNNAVLVGNLMSGTVIIDEGATLKGDISITSAQTEDVSVEEPDFDIE